MKQVSKTVKTALNEARTNPKVQMLKDNLYDFIDVLHNHNQSGAYPLEIVGFSNGEEAERDWDGVSD